MTSFFHRVELLLGFAEGEWPGVYDIDKESKEWHEYCKEIELNGKEAVEAGLNHIREAVDRKEQFHRSIVITTSSHLRKIAKDTAKTHNLPTDYTRAVDEKITQEIARLPKSEDLLQQIFQ